MSIVKKVIYLIVGLVMMFSLIAIPTQVKANGVSTFAYYDPSPVSFYGTCISVSKHYDGDYMAVEVNATAEDGISRELIIEVYVAYTNTTHRFRTYTDGVTRKADYIPISGGSEAIITARCSDSSVRITMDTKMYSW